MGSAMKLVPYFCPDFVRAVLPEESVGPESGRYVYGVAKEHVNDGINRNHA